MILEVGTASSGDVAELLGELSSLNRRLGGPGVEFVVNECRTWQLAKNASPAAGTESGKASNSDRSFVEIYAIPKASSAADAKTSAAHWDRFTASLFMVMRLDAGQANYFELSEAASREHPSFILAADAARRAGDKPTRSESKTPPGSDASIDALNQHLQKIEELRRKFEREDAMVLELAPAVDITPEEPAAASVAEGPQPQGRRRSVAMIAAAAVTVGLLIGGGGMYFLRPGSAKPSPAAATETDNTSSNR